MTIRISGVEIRPGTEQPVSIHFDGDGGKPWKPCKSMSRVLVAAWGPDANVYVGRSATLYRDPTVKWGGMEVGGIRVSHLSHIKGQMVMALTATKGSRKPYVVKPIEAPQPAVDEPTEWAKGFVAQVRAADTLDALKALTADQAVVEKRGMLTKHRPKLAERVDAAVAARVAELQPDDGWPGPDVPAAGSASQ